jgi:hypothetical protein
VIARSWCLCVCVLSVLFGYMIYAISGHLLSTNDPDVGCHFATFVVSLLAFGFGCDLFSLILALYATWLILPVVICLSQRLSHACASMN